MNFSDKQRNCYFSPSINSGGYGYHNPPPQRPRSPMIPAYLMGEPIMSPSGYTSTDPALLTGCRNTNKTKSPPPLVVPNTSNSIFNTYQTRVVTHKCAPPCGGRRRGGGGRDSGSSGGGVPPVMGLMESVMYDGDTTFQQRTTAQYDAMDCSSLMHRQYDHITPWDEQMLNNYQQTNLLSPAQADPFCHNKKFITSHDVTDDTCVTVFGFHPAMTSYIVQEFAQFGTILEHNMSSNGNWLELRYQTKHEASKALRKNGHVFGRSVMVGVIPCVAMDVSCLASTPDHIDTPAPATPVTPEPALVTPEPALVTPELVTSSSVTPTPVTSDTSVYYPTSCDVTINADYVPSPDTIPSDTCISTPADPASCDWIPPPPDITPPTTHTTGDDNGCHQRKSTKVNRMYSTMRPLTAAYKAAINDSVVSGMITLPRKSSTMYERVKEFMFGW